jgi:hypothetical protein
MKVHAKSPAIKYCRNSMSKPDNYKNLYVSLQAEVHTTAVL